MTPTLTAELAIAEPWRGLMKQWVLTALARCRAAQKKATGVCWEPLTLVLHPRVFEALMLELTDAERERLYRETESGASFDTVPLKVWATGTMSYLIGRGYKIEFIRELELKRI